MKWTWEELGPSLQKALELIQKVEAKQGLMLVHCHEGKSRAPAQNAPRSWVRMGLEARTMHSRA